MNDAHQSRAIDEAFLTRLLSAMEDLLEGNFRRRLPVPNHPQQARIAEVFNEIAARNQFFVG